MGLSCFSFLKNRLTLCEQMNTGLQSRHKCFIRNIALACLSCSHYHCPSPPIFLSSSNLLDNFPCWIYEFESFLSTSHSFYFQDSCGVRRVMVSLMDRSSLERFNVLSASDSDPRNRTCQLEKQACAPINTDQPQRCCQSNMPDVLLNYYFPINLNMISKNSS